MDFSSKVGRGSLKSQIGSTQLQMSKSNSVAMEKEDYLLTRADVEAAFNFFDVRKRGDLKPRDLKTRLSAFYPEMTNKEFKFLLDEATETGGNFTVDSLWHIIENYQKIQATPMSNVSAPLQFDPVQEAFHIYDPQGRGVVEVDVLASIMNRIGYGDLSQEEIDILIRTADFDKDGKVNLDDFRKLLKIELKGMLENSSAHALLKEFPQFHLIAQTPQLQFLFTIIRDKSTARPDFVFYSERIIRLVVEASLSFLPVQEKTVMTPTDSTYKGCTGCAQGIMGVSILRAGESMERALRETCRGIRIGKILVQRDESSVEKGPDARYNYTKLPKDVSDRHVLLLDPMIASGGSVIHCTEILVRDHGVPEENIIFLNLISCPEGIRRYLKRFPKVQVVTAAIDETLNDKKYLVPGLGDFGDRYFGTDE